MINSYYLYPFGSGTGNIISILLYIIDMVILIEMLIKVILVDQLRYQ